MSGQADSFAQVSIGQSGTIFADTGVKYGHVCAYYVTTVNGGVEGAAKTNVILVYVFPTGVGSTSRLAASASTSGKTRAKR
jgi:hypothetical protein